MSLTRSAFFIGCFFAMCITSTSSASTGLGCRSVVFGGKIRAGEKFVKEIGGGLSLVLSPDKFANERDAPSIDLSGWSVGLFLASPKTSYEAGQDFIWPVNPPFHFNPTQDIGTSYGYAAVEKLRRPIDYDFVLNWIDYVKISAAASDAIWPYYAKDPDHAGENYIAVLNSLMLGQIKFSPVRYVTTEKGMSILKLEFRVQISTPSTFPFLTTLAPRQSACPARKT